MSFDWTDYLALAEQLASDASSGQLDEAKWRSAISRAYYAAFISGRNFLVDNEGYEPSKTGMDHKEVRDIYASGSSRSRKSIASYLGRLNFWRTKADYEGVLSAKQSSFGPTSALALEQARRTLDMINQL